VQSLHKHKRSSWKTIHPSVDTHSYTWVIYKIS